MKKILSVILLGILLAFNTSVKASHVAGGDMDYVWLGGNDYRLILHLYRDCSGIPMNASEIISAQTSCGTTFNYTATLYNPPNGSNISQICEADSLQSTCYGGALPGIQEYIYYVDVTLPVYSTGCNSWTFFWTTCCRNTSVNIFGSLSESMYIYTTLNADAAPGNNSPYFSAQPVPYVCAGQTVTYNFGAIETDGDSLVYSLAQAYGTGITNLLVYNSGYTFSSPIPGITLNSQTGQMTFTPTLLGNFVVVLQVNEYNSNGVLIGVIRRDIQFVVNNCSNSLPSPFAGTITNLTGTGILVNPNTVQLCEGGNISFDLTFSDPNATDVLNLLSNVTDVLPGVTGTVTGTNPVLVHLDWTAPAGTAGQNNNFIIIAQDDACPIYGSQTYNYNINVLPATVITPSQTVICGNQTATLYATGGTSFTWYNLAGQQIPVSAQFSCNNCPSPTVKPTVTTSYVVQSNFNGLCGNRDTVTITVAPNFTYNFSATTLTPCTNQQIQLSANPSPAGTYYYLWGPNAYLDYDTVANPNATFPASGTYYVGAYILSAQGCLKLDSVAINVSSQIAPGLTVNQSSIPCSNQPVTLNLSVLGGGNNCGITTTPCSGPSTSYTAGTGVASNAGTGYPAPFGNWFKTAKHQFLYTAAELTSLGMSAGKITAIGFINTSLNTSTTLYRNYTIRMGCTSTSDFSSTLYETGLYTVYNPKNYNVTLGVNTLPFDQYFLWDGVSNVVVEICFNNLIDVSYTNNVSSTYTTTAFSSCIYSVDDNQDACSVYSFGTAVNIRPNTIFTYCSAPVGTGYSVSWSPTTGLSNPNSFSPTVQANSPVQTYTATVTSNTGGCGNSITYPVQYQNVAPVITASGPVSFCSGNSVQLSSNYPVGNVWSNGSSAQTITVTSSGNYTVTNTNGGCTATSAPVNVVVNPLPAVPSITASGFIICGTNPVTLSVPAVAGISYQWYLNNVIISGATSPTYSAITPGVYTVRATNTFSCTSVSNPVTITSGSLPAVPVVTPPGPVSACTGTPVTLTANVSNGVWSNGSSGQTTVVTTSGSYTVTVTNGQGCSSTSNPVVVTFNSVPATPQITPSGSVSICQGQSTTLTVNATTGILWSNGATSQTITVTSGGNYSVTVTNAQGCSASSAITSVNVNPTPPVPNVTASGSTTFCQGGSVTLTSSSLNNNVWSNGSTTQSITVTASGNYSVTVTNAQGCSSTSSSTPVTVNTLPAVPNITPSGSGVFCQGGSVTLTSSALSGNTWSTGATGTSITVNQSGNYSVTVTTAQGCSATSTPFSVSVNPNPSVPVITPSGALTFCAGGSVDLSSNGSGNNTWSNGSSGNSITVSTSGTYTTTTTDANGCSATSAPTTVTVNSIPVQPVIQPTGATTFCQGGSVQLNSSMTSNIVWSNGATTPGISVNSSGTYTVTFTDGNGCSNTSAPVTVTVNALPAVPVVTASGATTFCQGGSVILSSSSATGNTWSNGNTTQQITVATAGSYSVTVTDVNGCSSQSPATAVTVNALPATPVITANGSTNFCQGGSVQLSSSAASGNTWSNGSTGQSISVSTSGTYTVTVTDANSCSSVSAPLTVTASNNPVADAGIDQSVPYNTSTSLSGNATAGSGNYNYNWSPAGIFVDPSLQNPLTNNLTATQLVILSVTDNTSGCTGQDTVLLTITGGPLGVQISSSADTVCVGGSVSLNALAGGGTGTYTYTWNATNGASGSGSVLTDNPLVNTTYTVIVDDGLGNTTATYTVYTSAGPAAPVTTPAGAVNFCQGGSVVISSSYPSNNVWSNGDVSASTTINTSGTYTVSYTDALGCSSTSLPVTVTVFDNPVVTLGNDVSVCDGDSLTLTASVSSGTPAYNYFWNNGLGNNNTHTIVPISSAQFTVYVTDANNCSSNTDDINITLNTPPSVPTVSVAGTQLTSSPGSSYQWYLNGNAITGATSQVYNIVTTGTYNVCITEPSGCSACSADILITESSNLSASGFGFMPVPFSDYLQINAPAEKISAQTNLIILDASGKKVYESRITEQLSKIETANWERGLYFIQIIDEGKLLQQSKLVKMD